jgi:hypothetical protein
LSIVGFELSLIRARLIILLDRRLLHRSRLSERGAAHSTPE